ncbi:KH domain-containing protein [Artemisia annua]|uniref:KH domain-containing protein n=1 Tax=Artemisia annua TaxID=35608 RepID=A0A2U1NA58_ARTAN|nr:KH domain-containing protein [Artemisia annua]
MVQVSGSYLKNSSLCENLRVSAILSNQGFNDLDRLPHRSLSLMASAGLTGWNGFSQERLSGQWQWTGKELQLVLVIHNDANLADESEDYIKRQQVRELAMLNSDFRKECHHSTQVA